MSEIFKQLELRRIYADQRLDNVARDARLGLVYETRGSGERKLEAPVPFGLTFVERPLFSQGLEIADHTLVAGSFPMGQVGVWKWQRSSRGHYIGAYLYFVVYGSARRLNFHMKFEGEALKSVAGDEDT